MTLVEMSWLLHAGKHGFIAIPKGWFELFDWADFSWIVHIDKQGLIAIPKDWQSWLLRSTMMVFKMATDNMIWYLVPGEEKGLLDASQFMDRCLSITKSLENSMV